MLTQHNRKTARLSPDYTLAIHELGVWSGDETKEGVGMSGVTFMRGTTVDKDWFYE